MIERRAALQTDDESLLQADRCRACIAVSQEARDLRDLMQALAEEQATGASGGASAGARRAAAARGGRGTAGTADQRPPDRALPPPASTKRFADAQGHVTPPVRGQVTLPFGQPGEAGSRIAA